MKTITLLVFASLLFLTEVKAEDSALIVRPTHIGSGLPYSYTATSPDGVCKSLGFEKSAKGSLRYGREGIDSIQVNDNGEVSGGEKAWELTQIICVNKKNTFPNERSILIHKPIHRDTRLPFSYTQTSHQGVCKALGHRRLAKGSGRYGNDGIDSIQVDDEGHIVSSVRTWQLVQIVCVGPR